MSTRRFLGKNECACDEMCDGEGGRGGSNSKRTKSAINTPCLTHVTHSPPPAGHVLLHIPFRAATPYKIGC